MGNAGCSYRGLAESEDFTGTIPQSPPQGGDSSLCTREPLHKGAFGFFLLRVKSLPCVRGGGSPAGDPEGLRR